MLTKPLHWLRQHLVPLFSILFAACYTLEPLYTPNQCVRFIFGIKKSGYGLLANDWFANTLDPLIPFQYLVYLTSKYLHPDFFYLYHFLFLGLYFFILLKLILSIYNINQSHLKFILFATLLIFLHSGFLKFGLKSSLGCPLFQRQ